MSLRQAAGALCGILAVAGMFAVAGAESQPEPLPLVGPERDVLPQGDHAFRPSVAVEPRPRDGRHGFELERLWSGYDDWEPVTAADPSSPFVYQITTRLAGPRACHGCAKNSVIFRRSRDGGATWEDDQFLIASSVDQYDPQIRVANDGTVFVAFLLGFKPGVTFERSSDRGTTWSDPISFSGPHQKPAWSDRPALAISPSGRDVYIGFNHSDSWIVASHDGGRTFAPPVQTSHDRRYYFHSAGTVAPNGNVYYVAEDYSQTYRGDVHIDVIRSNDGGASWSTVRVDTGRQTPACHHVRGCYFGFLGPVAGLASDPAGNLLLAYNVNNVPNAPQRLYARTSRDGASWSPRVEISGTPLSVDNAFPAVAAAGEPGDFRVAWMNAPIVYWNTWYRRLARGVWGPVVRLSNREHGTEYTHPAGFDFPYGDYLGIAVDGRGATHVIWGAGPSYRGPGGTWYTRGT